MRNQGLNPSSDCFVVGSVCSTEQVRALQDQMQPQGKRVRGGGGHRGGRGGIGYQQQQQHGYQQQQQTQPAGKFTLVSCLRSLLFFYPQNILPTFV